jgi:hypothetical protein
VPRVERSATDGEYELVLKFSEEERADIVAMLEDDGYEKNIEGVRAFLLDCARDDGDEETDEAAERAERRAARGRLFTAAMTHPDVLNAIQKAAPIAAALVKRALRRQP